MVLDPFVEHPQPQRSLYDQAHTSLARTKEVVGPTSLVIEEVSADNGADAPTAGVLDAGDAELHVLVGYSYVGEDDGVVVGEDEVAIPCYERDVVSVTSREGEAAISRMGTAQMWEFEAK